MKNEKFKNVDLDFDYRVSEMTMEGRLTPNRYKTLTKFVKKWNYNHKAPYGISENGYAYNCGCEHDCCGCLCGESMQITFDKINESLHKVIIRYSASFNY